VATARIVEAYVRDEQAILTVSRHVDDFHGIRQVCFSLPSVISAAGVGPALPLRLNTGELEGLRASAAAIRQVIERVGLT
jgi:L-lactate dehydrogenase